MSSQNVHEQHLKLARQVVDALATPRSPELPLFLLAGVWLIGSVARGEDQEQSDVDVVVTHAGPEETFPFAFLDALWASLEEAKLPLRPPRTRRSDKFPASLHVITRSEEAFQNPASIRQEDFGTNQAWENTVQFWREVRSDAVKLYPKTN